MSSPVMLINVFEIPAGTEDAFIKWWKHCSEVLRDEPGFLDAQLHRSQRRDSRFRFINIAHWETEEALDQARVRNKAVLQSIPAGKGNPALYEVAVQY